MTTDAEIDGLSGFQLDEAMKRAGAFQPASMCSPPLIGKWSAEPHPYHDDIGAAFGLILNVPYIIVGTGFSSVTVTRVKAMNDLPLSTGPKSEAASIFCRAWLKLKVREA